MIFINNKKIDNNHFPDGTFSSRIMPDSYDVNLTWLYDSDAEMAQIMYITRHLQEYGSDVCLFMPYIPNARMDRVKNDDELFTLKYFCDFINSLNFKYVEVLDAHSSVSLALLNGVTNLSPKYNIASVIHSINDDCLAMFYPDEGAMKRYAEMFPNIPYAFGVKKRDWRTGDIKGLQIIGEEFIRSYNVLIVDDICSKGGTFYHSAKALKEAGAEDIHLYISHCENTIADGELLKSDLISHIYTTDSIYRLNNNKITVIGDRR